MCVHISEIYTDWLSNAPFILLWFPGEEWSEAALDDFERLTYCAAWSPLQAKLCSYSHSDISSWPSVKLYDNSDGKVSWLLICYRVVQE